MVIRELLIRLGLTGTDGVGRGLDRVDGKVDKTIQSFNALGGVLATVFGAVTISNIAKTADEMQSLEARVGMLPQTITTGAEAFDTVAQRASDARQGIEEYASFYIKAGNATQDFYKDQEQVLQLTDAVSIALAASGSTAAAQGQAFFQLGQAIGSPTVQMEEMNTLIDVAPDLFRALGKSIPGANNNLKAFISTGKVTGKMLAEGLIKVLPQFVDQFKKMPMTIGQALVLLNNRWSMFINRLNRSSGAVTWIANKFLWLADKVEYSLDVVIEALGGAENAVKLLGVVLGSAGLVGAVYLLSAAFTALTSPLFLIIAALSVLFLIGEDVNSWLEGQESVLGRIIGPASNYKKSIDEITDSLRSLVEIFKEAYEWLGRFDKAIKNNPLQRFNDWTNTFLPEWLGGDPSENQSGNGGDNFIQRGAKGWQQYNRNQRNNAETLETPGNLLSMPSTLESMTRSAGAAYDRDRSLMGGTFAPNTNVYITVPAGTPAEQQSVIKQSAQETYGELSTKLGNTLNFNTGG